MWSRKMETLEIIMKIIFRIKTITIVTESIQFS